MTSCRCVIWRILMYAPAFGDCFKWLAVQSRVLPTEFQKQAALDQRSDFAARAFRAA